MDSAGTRAAAGPRQSLVVYRVRSLAQPASRVKVIAPPSCCSFQSVGAADDDRTFVAAASHSTGTRFYELRLSQTGQPEPLVPLSVSLPGYVRPDSVALSPDGRELAAVVLRRNGPQVPYRISVIAMPTGRTRTWTWRGPPPQYLAWSGDHHIDFIATPHDGGSRLVRLSTSAPARRTAFRVLVSQFASLAPWSPWSADGPNRHARWPHRLRSARRRPPSSPRPAAALGTTGRPLRVLVRPRAPGAGARVDNGWITRMYRQPTPDVPSSWAVFAW